MTYTTLTKQAFLIKKHLGITMNVPKRGPLPEGMEAWFLIPHYSKIADTYDGAVLMLVSTLKKLYGDEFSNRLDGKIDADNLRRIGKYQTPEIIPCQLGTKYRGQSVKEARNFLAGRSDEIALGAYEVLMIAITNPQLIDGSYWGIDCAADEYSLDADGVFVRSPCVYFGDGGVGFCAGFADAAYSGFGSASGFLSHLFQPRCLPPVAPLSGKR